MNRSHYNIPDLARKALLTYAAMMLLFSLSIILSYFIPPSLIRDNVLSSVPYQQLDASIKYEEPPRPRLAAAYDTTAIMLSIASHGGGQKGSIAQDAMHGAFYYNSSIGMINSVEEGIDLPANINYERYWHGWLIFLKPLLIFFSYPTIKVLLSSLIIVLLIILTITCRATHLGILPAAILAVTLAFFGKVVFFSLPSAIPIVVSLAGSILLLRFLANTKNYQHTIPLAFFIIGGCTAFLDFLVTPLLTFLIPLCFTTLLLFKNRTYHQKHFILLLIISGLFWASGYIGLWASKWILASAILHENIISSSLEQVLFRLNTSNSGYSFLGEVSISEINGWLINPINSIWINYSYWPLLGIIIALLVCTSLSIIVITIKQRNKQKTFYYSVLFCLAFIPYLWFAVTPNHSMIHVGFTYRGQIATVFALLLIAIHFLLEYAKSRRKTKWDKPEIMELIS